MDELKLLIKNSTMKPKPVVGSMFFIHDWRAFIEGMLHPIKYHTRYNSFYITSENGMVKFRCKRFPQSPEYGPKEGVLILKDKVNLKSKVGAASFRIESLCLDQLLNGIRKLF